MFFNFEIDFEKKIRAFSILCLIKYHMVTVSTLFISLLYTLYVRTNSIKNNIYFYIENKYLSVS